MSSGVPLILSEEPVTRTLLARMKVSKPNIAVVYADAFGQVAYLGGRPLSWSEQVRSRYRTRYEVDLSDQRRIAQLDSSPLPARGDAYFFRSTVDVGFRVHDPTAVVRRHVTDALPVVYNFLIDAFRPVTRRHEIRDAQGAETELNLLFGHPVELEEGITIYRCATRLLPDHAAQQYLHSLESADRSLTVGEAEHRVAAAASRHEHELAGMAQRARLEAEERERESMSGEAIDLPGLIRAHLARHPDETSYALELLARHEQAQLVSRDINDKRSMDLFRYMIEQGMVQSADLDVLRGQALGRIQEIAAPSRPAELPAGSWDDPLPDDPAPVLSLTPEPATGAHRQPGAGSAAASAVPVYVIIDESPADPGYFDALNNGIRTLPGDLAEHPGIIDAVRLAVLGYAGDVVARMPLNTIAPETFVPPLAPRPGARLGAVFEYLRERIPADVSRLKTRELTVGRPVVYLLCATAPEDAASWPGQYQLLADRAGFPLAPNIVACGAGGAPPEVIAEIAANPQALGWVAGPGQPLGEAAARYAAFVRRSIVTLASAHVTGSHIAVWEPPEGFRPAAGPA